MKKRKDNLVIAQTLLSLWNLACFSQVLLSLHLYIQTFSICWLRRPCKSLYSKCESVKCKLAFLSYLLLTYWKCSPGFFLWSTYGKSFLLTSLAENSQETTLTYWNVTYPSQKWSCFQKSWVANHLLKSQYIKIAILYLAENTERAQVQMHIQKWLLLLYWTKNYFP